MFARVEKSLIDHRFALLWGGFAVLCALSLWDLMGRMERDEKLPYAVTDLLINYGDGFVRRGLFGEVAIALSSVFGGVPAVWAWGMAIGLTAAVFALSIRLFRHLPAQSGTLLLVLAPAALMFMVYDPIAALRKEVFGFLVILTASCASLSGSVEKMRIWLALSAAAFICGVLSHEVLVFLAPAFVLSWMLIAVRWPGQIRLLLGVGLGMAVFAVLASIAIVLAGQPDVAAICAAAQMEQCSGSMGSIDGSIAEGIAQTFENRSVGSLFHYLFYFVLAYLPFTTLRMEPGYKWALPVALIGVSVGMAPMYVLGFDYGRWIHMSTLSLSLLAATAIALGIAQFHWRWPPVLVLVYLGTWSFHHVSARWEFNAFYVWPALAVLVALRWGLQRSGRQPVGGASEHQAGE